jgi:hypothetical protein
MARSMLLVSISFVFFPPDLNMKVTFHQDSSIVKAMNIRADALKKIEPNRCLIAQMPTKMR